jgi:hypothetical protein
MMHQDQAHLIRRILKFKIVLLLILLFFFCIHQYSINILISDYPQDKPKESSDNNLIELKHLNTDSQGNVEVLVGSESHERLVIETTLVPPHDKDNVRSGLNQTPPYFVKQPEDIELDEDFDIYILNLTEYAYDNEDTSEKLKWYFTQENTSLINVTNENSTTQEIILKSVDNAFGENTLKLWVMDTTGRNDFREIHITILPENDLPTISQTNLPPLTVHPDSPYYINLRPYIIDFDNSINEIKVTVAVEDQNIATIKKHTLFLDFRNKKNFDKDFITIELSDNVNIGETSAVELKINITNNHPPIVLRKLPDVILYKGERLRNIIDLDYYFDDPDLNKSTLSFLKFEAKHFKIIINDDNTVDITPVGSWVGEEFLIFRCLDPDGAFVEQVINATILTKYFNIIFKEIPDISVHYDYEYIFNLTPYIKSDRTNEILKFEIFEFISNDWKDFFEYKNIELENIFYPILKINYSVEYNGNIIPIFISISSGELTRFQEFVIKVTDNHPPTQKKVFKNQVINEDDSKKSIFDLYEHFLDIENENLDFIAFGEKIQTQLNENGLVDISSESNWFGEELITLRAIDSDGAISESSILFTVNPINDPPIILDIPEINITKGVTSHFNFTKFLNDVDNNIYQLLVTVESEHITVAGNFLILNYPSSIKGEQEFTLEVSDGELSDSKLVKVNIQTIKTNSEANSIQISPIIFWVVMIILIVLFLSLVVVSIVYINRVRHFRFNEIYLIYKDGLLIAHAMHGEESGYDSDIIGSMFTAIQDFISESIADSHKEMKGSPLKRLDFGNFQIVINRGEYIYIAAIFTGYPLKKMMLKIENLRKDIENKYADVLPNWNGEMGQLKGTKKMIGDLLTSTGSEERDLKTRQIPPDSSDNSEESLDEADSIDQNDVNKADDDKGKSNMLD